MRQRKRKPNKSAGFSEDAAGPYQGAAKASAPMRQTVELGAGGRLVIPAPMRAALGMKVGDRLTVQCDENELRIYTYEEGLRQAREILRKYIPAGVDPVDDFLRWKREQAALEKSKFKDRKIDE
jgi:bifunctional DNA-binding transcriptional regulator/antitoxin component of YhaV-PrlF toxin-antitoxin module